MPEPDAVFLPIVVNGRERKGRGRLKREGRAAETVKLKFRASFLWEFAKERKNGEMGKRDVRTREDSSLERCEDRVSFGLTHSE